MLVWHLACLLSFILKERGYSAMIKILNGVIDYDKSKEDPRERPSHCHHVCNKKREVQHHVLNVFSYDSFSPVWRLIFPITVSVEFELIYRVPYLNPPKTAKREFMTELKRRVVCE